MDDIEEYKLDFEYVRDCTDRRELRKIVKKLRAEPFYPELTKLAEEKLREVDPSSKLVFKAPEPSQDERSKAISELDSWVSSIGQKDLRIKDRAKKNQAFTPSIPPVRGTRAYEAERERARKLRAKPDLAHLPEKGAEPAGDASKAIWEDGQTVGDGTMEGRSEEELEFMADQYRLRGNESFRRKRFAEALEWYTKSLKAQPTESAYTNRALMHLKLNRHKEAEFDCTQALIKNPTSAKALMRRGQARQGMEAFSGAISDFEKALKLVEEKKRPQVEKYLLACEKAQAKAKKAAAERKKRADEARGKGKTRMAIVEDDDSDSDDEPTPTPAIATAKKTRRLQIVEESDSSDDEGGDEKVVTSPAVEPVKVAKKEMEWPARVAVRVKKAEAMKQKATVLYKNSKYVDAVSVLTEAVTSLESCRSPPLEPAETNERLLLLLGTIHGNIAACASQARLHDRTVTAATAALEVAPMAPTTTRGKWRLRRGQANEVLERHHEALCDMTAVIRLGGGSLLATKAVPRLRAACKAENPPRIAGAKRRGNALFKEKKYAEATRIYQNAISIATSKLVPFRDTKTTAALYTNLALCQLSLSDHPGAITACTSALKINSSNSTALRRRAMAYAAIGDSAKALSDLRNAAVALEADSKQKGAAGAKAKKLLAATRKEIERIGGPKAADAPVTPVTQVVKGVEEVENKEQKAETKKGWTKMKIVDVTPHQAEEKNKSEASVELKKHIVEDLKAPSRESLRAIVTAPKTTVEANSVLKSISHDDILMEEWVGLVKPKQFKTLFKAAGSLELDHLGAIIRALAKRAVKDPETAVKNLKYLSKSSRFGLNVSMVDEEAEKALAAMFDGLEAEAAKGVLNAVEVEALKDVYL